MTEEAPEGPSTPQLELRLALAMRGGVSLAVWIGGAIAELDLARRGMLGGDALPDPGPERDRAEAYAELLHQLGYSGLTVDVLAGASAGGLNAVIYGFAQSVGTDLEWLQGVWANQGDLWTLFHPAWDSEKPYRTEAVFDADRNFYGKVHDQLLKQGAHPNPRLRTDYLTVDLAATLQSGPPLPDLKTGVDLRPRTGHFRFRRTPASPGAFNDMPSLELDREPIRRLAYAARATSSFPGAFEPAGVFSWEAEQPGVDDPPDPDGLDLPSNMAAVFSEVTLTPESTFDVMDGGVFDNIPIGRAIQAIADAPASKPTQRILIYLDPSPPHAGPAVKAPKAFEGGRRQMRAWFVRSALTALRYKQTVESANDDLNDLNQLRRAVTDVQSRRRLFLDTLPEPLAGPATGADLATRYRRLRAQTDAARLCSLLTAPGVGFLRALVPSPPVATALGVIDVDVAKEAVRTALAARQRYDCTSDPAALVAATDLFVSWLRRFQDDPDEASEELDAVKLRIYRVRLYAQYLRQAQEREAVIQALGTSDSPEPTPQTVIDGPSVALALWPEPVTDGAPPPAPGDLADDEGLWADALPAAEAATSRDVAAWTAVGWQALCQAVNALPAGAARRAMLEDTRRPGDPTGELTPAIVQHLQLAASLALGELSTVAVPDFYTFSGDQTPMNAAALPNVVTQGHAQAIDADMRARRTPQAIEDAEALNAGSKLAGNQLANFAGFLSADWRTHDWQWGRLDAGAALVATLKERHPDEDPTIFDAITGHIDASYTSDLNRRKLTVADLPPGRRYALAARLGLGLQRALWPLTPKAVNPQGFRLADLPGLVALIALRPLLVLLPLVLRPPVLAGVVVSVAGAQHWTRETTHHPLGLGPATFSVAAVVGIALLTAQVSALLLARSRWGPLVDGRAGEFRSAVRSLLLRRATTGVLAALVLVVLIVVRLGDWSWSSALRDALARTTGFEAIVVLAAIGALGLRARRTGADSVVQRDDPAPRDTVGWVVEATLAVLTLGLAWVVSVGKDDGGVAAAKVATSVAVGAVVWAVHHAWAQRSWPEVMALISGGATAWLLLGKPPLGFGPGRRLFPGSWISGDWGPFLQVLLFAIIVALVFVVGLLSRWLTTRLDVLGPILSLLLMMSVALWGAWQLTLAWGWLSGIPTGLVYGSAIAAATTLFAPFRDEID